MASLFYQINLIFCIILTNSSLFLVLTNISMTFSTASSGFMLFSAFRITLIACSSSSERSRSSRLVLDFGMLIAGNTRYSESLRSSTISILPVPLNSSYTTSSILLPVSTSAVARIVRLPPSRILRAAPKNLLGI